MNVGFDAFIEYKCNLAFNRQTRMLAVYDSNFTVCDYIEKRDTNESFYDRELLRRAKLGLDSLAFFGIAEYQHLSRQLFSKAFNEKLVIKKNAVYFYNLKSRHSKGGTMRSLKSYNLTRLALIKNVNLLDVELYNYAVAIFKKRLRSFYLV
jgi:hypothetical protein